MFDCISVLYAKKDRKLSVEFWWSSMRNIINKMKKYVVENDERNKEISLNSEFFKLKAVFSKFS